MQLTTAHMLTVTSFYIMNNPKILERMQAEMKGIWPGDGSPPKWLQLEQLSYLVSTRSVVLSVDSSWQKKKLTIG